PELKAIDKEKLSRTFYDYAHNSQLQSFYLVGIDGNIEFDIENLESEQSNRLFMRELGVKILAGYSQSEEAIDTESISEGFLDQVITRKGQLHQIVWPGSGAKKLIFSDVANSDSGRPVALIAVLDKLTVDRSYLKQAITNQYRSNPDHEIIIINSEDISDTIPKLSPTFKANLLPMLATARISSSIETDRITDENDTMLVALGQGSNIPDFLIGAQANWAKIMESIRYMYFLVSIGLFFSLAASTFMITVLLREFLAPISVLSSGAKSIIGGDLDLNLPVFARDELGELSETFNFMTRRLKNRLTELTVLYNMTQKASTSHNQREVFNLVAENLVKHLHGQSFGTAWINEGEGEESVYLADHCEESFENAVQSVVKNALRTYKIQLAFSEAIHKHILGIPLYFEEKKFGAVYLLFDADRFKNSSGFSEDEKSFMETLRHHLALIIEKQRLFEQAITDGLTKLYVRRFFLATLEKELSRSKRYQLDVAVLLIDIDHFKKFNDNFGHQAGDMVLRETAQRLTECIRSVDTPGRYGGEEMAILLPQTNIKEAFIVAERIKKAVEGAEYNYRDSVMRVTVSIGVSALHGRQITVEEIIEEADRALYVAKDKGRNQVRIAPEAM
ncbi:MAG: diguanylate cyclase, partial [Candidatus Riflebacteria bacterium]